MAVCSICDKSFRVPKSRTTTNLLAHLRMFHKEQLEKTPTSSKPVLEEPMDAQPKLDDMFKRKLSAPVKDNIHKKVVHFIASGSLPLSIVSLDSFRDLVQTLNPSYTPPGRKKLLSMMRSEVNDYDDSLKDILSRSEISIAITCDAWSSYNANCSLLAITAHVSGRTLQERTNLILDCVPLNESHTAAYVEEKIRGSFDRLGIDMSTVTYFVADGASVMRAAAANLNLKYVQCSAHVINLAARAALELDDVKLVLQKVKKIVTRLNRSGKVKIAYKRFLQEANLPISLPSTDCPTRWGSTFAMICDVLNSLPAVESLLCFLKMTPFEREEVKLLEAVRIFLEPLNTMTKQVCFQSSCVSMYIPVGKILIASVRQNCVAAKREARYFGEQLLGKLRHYFDEWFEDETHMASFSNGPSICLLGYCLASGNMEICS